MKKKKNKLNKFVIIGIIYFITLLTISTAYSFFNTDLSIHATTKIANDNNFNADYILEAKWQNGGAGQTYYHYSTTIKYEGTIPTIGWRYYIKIPYDTEVVGCYNADSCTIEGEILTIKNAQYNSTLSPQNQSVSFGFQIKTTEDNYQYKSMGAKFITNQYENIDSSNITTENKNQEDSYQNMDAHKVSYINTSLNIGNGWNMTSAYTINVSNTSLDISIPYWSIDVFYPVGSTISSIWGGEYEYDETTGKLTLHGPGWNSTLSPNSNNQITLYIETPYPNPYIPTVGVFTGITSTGEKIESDIVLGGNQS